MGETRFPASASISCSLKSSVNREKKYGLVWCSKVFACINFSSASYLEGTFLVLQRVFATERPRDCDSLEYCHTSTNSKHNNIEGKITEC